MRAVSPRLNWICVRAWDPEAGGWRNCYHHRLGQCRARIRRGQATMNDSTAQFKLDEDPFFAEDLRQMAEAKNYLRWQFGMIAPHIHGKVLEIGGGIGNFTPAIARAAEAVTSLEPNRACFRQLAQNTQSLRNVTVLNATAEALDAQLPADYLADTVVCMNVLEHIQN